MTYGHMPVDPVVVTFSCTILFTKMFMMTSTPSSSSAKTYTTVDLAAITMDPPSEEGDTVV